MAEFSITPIGEGESIARYVADCLRIVEENGLNYKINPMGTVVEGNFDEVMALIARCHKATRKVCNRVSTIIKIDDHEGSPDALSKKIESVERIIGQKLKT